MSPTTTNEQTRVQSQAAAALESYLDPDYEVEEAISSFIQPVYDLYSETLPTEEQLADALDGIWNALLDKAISTPYSDDVTQGRLVTFTKKLQSLPPPDQPAPKIWDLALWSDLPILGAVIRQRWNTGPIAENTHWLNLNAFAARLTASQVVDLSLYAIWTMRDALETPLGEIETASRDQTLRAAALWIELCGERLRSLEQVWEVHPTKGDPARGGPLYNGPHGFCGQRWEFWRERFTSLGEEESLQVETRRVLSDAAGRMGAQ